jgi:hypothetical protein
MKTDIALLTVLLTLATNAAIGAENTGVDANGVIQNLDPVNHDQITMTLAYKGPTGGLVSGQPASLSVLLTNLDSPSTPPYLTNTYVGDSLVTKPLPSCPTVDGVPTVYHAWVPAHVDFETVTGPAALSAWQTMLSAGWSQIPDINAFILKYGYDPRSVMLVSRTPGYTVQTLMPGVDRSLPVGIIAFTLPAGVVPDMVNAPSNFTAYKLTGGTTAFRLQYGRVDGGQQLMYTIPLIVSQAMPIPSPKTLILGPGPALTWIPATSAASMRNLRYQRNGPLPTSVKIPRN